MTQRQAVKILKYHQRWRRGADIPMKHSPLELSQALDLAIKTMNDVIEMNKLIKVCR